MENVAAVMSRAAEIHRRITPPQSSGEFAAHLQRQMSASPEPFDAGVHDLAHTSHVEAGLYYGTAAPSAELQRYLQVNGVESRNGRLQGSGLLVETSGSWYGNGQLLAPAATAWESMRAAAATDGVDLRTIDTYRTYESQARAYQDHLSGKKKANVLPPGTSEHGNGLAIDVTNGALVAPGDVEWEWLNVHAREYGWYPISNESWHWEFRGSD